MAKGSSLRWLWRLLGLIVLIVAIGVVVLLVRFLGGPRPGSVKDEAMRAGLVAKDLPGSDSDYLRAMDRGLNADAVYDALHKAVPSLSKDEAWKAYNRGRNNWVVWTAGNDTLWDFLANNSFGAFDLLKIVSLPSRASGTAGTRGPSTATPRRALAHTPRPRPPDMSRASRRRRRIRPAITSTRTTPVRGEDRQFYEVVPAQPVEVFRTGERAGLPAVGSQGLRLEG